jgi:AMMECR1 domain-containing protein
MIELSVNPKRIVKIVWHGRKIHGIIYDSAQKSGVYLPQVEALRVVRDVDDGPKTDRFGV